MCILTHPLSFWGINTTSLIQVSGVQLAVGYFLILRYFWFLSLGVPGFVISKTPRSTNGWICLFLLTDWFEIPNLSIISWEDLGTEQKLTISFCTFVNGCLGRFCWFLSWLPTWLVSWLVPWVDPPVWCRLRQSEPSAPTYNRVGLSRSHRFSPSQQPIGLTSISSSPVRPYPLWWSRLQSPRQVQSFRTGSSSPPTGRTEEAHGEGRVLLCQTEAGGDGLNGKLHYFDDIDFWNMNKSLSFSFMRILSE